MEVCPLCHSRLCALRNPDVCITLRVRKAPEAPAVNKMVERAPARKSVRNG